MAGSAEETLRSRQHLSSKDWAYQLASRLSQAAADRGRLKDHRLAVGR